MSLIVVTPRSQEEQKVRAKGNVAQLVSNSTINTLRSLADVQREGIKVVWNHPILSPQEVVDELGPNGLEAFREHGSLTNLVIERAAMQGVTVLGRTAISGTMHTLIPGAEGNALSITISLPEFDFAFSEDGKVTISDQPYTPVNPSAS